MTIRSRHVRGATLAAPLVALLAIGCKTQPAPRTPAETAAESSTGLRDGQILSIVLAEHNSEISESQYALAHTSNDAVRDFASNRVSSHTHALREAGQLGEHRHIRLETSHVAERLLGESRQQVLRMSHESGASLDRTYVDGEVASDREFLQILDDVLIRGATDDRLQTLLGDTRSSVSSDLSHAEELAHNLTH